MDVLEVTPEPVLAPRTPAHVSPGLLPGWLAHKTSLAEVLLTEVLAPPDNCATVHMQWPRAHYFYETQSGAADTLLLAESLRQITVGVAHMLYEVPFGMTFVLSALNIKNDYLIPGFSRTAPTNVVARVSIDGLLKRRTGLNALRINVSFFVGSKPFASGSLAAQILHPAVYARLRQGKAAPTGPIAPVQDARPKELPYGRPSECDRAVELLPSGQGWRLTSDPCHPILFDHPLDHVPGMFVVEAIRQTLRQLYPRRTEEPLGMVIDYVKMIELSSDCILQVRPMDGDGLSSLSFEFVQDGETVAHATVNPGLPANAATPILPATSE